MASKLKSIVLFGEALIDEFPTMQSVGGAPFNVARHLAAFHANPMLLTRIGADNYGAMVRAEFARFGLRQEGLQTDESMPTGRVRVQPDSLNHRFVIEPDQAYDQIDAAQALEALTHCAPATLYFGTLAQRGARSRQSLSALLATTSAQRFLDLNLREGQTDQAYVSTSLHEADVVKVNESELQELFAWFNPAAPVIVDTVNMTDPRVHLACLRLMQQFSLAGLLVTLGERGAIFVSADGERSGALKHGNSTSVVDTVGAGDAFTALYLVGRARRWPLALTLQRANQFAAAICSVAGAVPADITFYEPWIARWLAD